MKRKKSNDARIVFMQVECEACETLFVPETAYIELDWSGCYYEGDQPGSAIEVVCTKCGQEHKISYGFNLHKKPLKKYRTEL